MCLPENDSLQSHKKNRFVVVFFLLQLIGIANMNGSMPGNVSALRSAYDEVKNE